MCQVCWAELGAPADWNAAVATGVRLAREVYKQPRGSAGGNLHIVLDDWNLENDNIRYCMDTNEIVLPGRTIDTTLTPVERECAEHFLTMSMDERGSVLAVLDNYVGESDPEDVIFALGVHRIALVTGAHFD